MFNRIITPRISETNIRQHIGHSAIPVWLEEGYIEILRLFGPDLARPPLIMVNLNMDFIGEIFLGRDVEIRTGVKKIGSSSLHLQQEIHQDGRICVRSSTTFVHFDYETRTPIPIPGDVCDRLREHLLET